MGTDVVLVVVLVLVLGVVVTRFSMYTNAFSFHNRSSLKHAD